jgi:hypothetical protein
VIRSHWKENFNLPYYRYISYLAQWLAWIFIFTFSHFDFYQLQISPGWPDWANFHLLGDYFLWAVFENWYRRPIFWAIFSTKKSFVLILTKKIGCATQTNLVTLDKSSSVGAHLLIRRAGDPYSTLVLISDKDWSGHYFFLMRPNLNFEILIGWPI